MGLSYRNMRHAALALAAAVGVAAVLALTILPPRSAAPEGWDYLTLQAWLATMERAALSDFAAAQCGRHDVDSRLDTLRAARDAGADDAMLRGLAARYDLTLAQRRDRELAARTSGNPGLSRYNWLYPAIRCEERADRPRQLDPTQIYRGE